MGRFTITGNSFDEDNNNVITAPNNLVSCQCSFVGKNNVLKIPSHAKLNNLIIEFLGDDGYCEIDNSPRLSGIIRIGHSSSVIIEKGVTSTNRIYLTCAEGTRVFIGEDCMFATNNQIRTDDAHGIYDVHTGKRVNPARNIHIGKHVWLGFNATILGGGTYRRWLSSGNEFPSQKEIPQQLRNSRQSCQNNQKRYILGKTIFTKCQRNHRVHPRATNQQKSLQSHPRIEG